MKPLDKRSMLRTATLKEVRAWVDNEEAIEYHLSDIWSMGFTLQSFTKRVHWIFREKKVRGGVKLDKERDVITVYVK